MIQQIHVLAQPALNQEHVTLEFNNNNNICSISLSSKNEATLLSKLTLVIELNETIASWRNHNYKWHKADKKLIANYYSPKVIKLSNGQCIMADSTIGIWEFNPQKPKQLLWHIHHTGATPVMRYGKNILREYITQEYKLGKLELGLITTSKPVEWSRSAVPFSSIVAFTDHCDYDSLLLVKEQRKLFKNNNIVITKGIFKYHFSKRDYNISLAKEEEVNELKKWEEDGHEIAYHSLSQSLKPYDKAWEDFSEIENPHFKVTTWIDHGYQPYNLTMRQRVRGGEIEDLDVWLRKVKSAGINTLWNYLDTFEAQPNIINQINADDATYKQVVKYTSGFSLKSKLSTRIRNYILYFADEQPKSNYWRLLKLKESIKKNPTLIFEAIKKGFSVAWMLFKIVLNSNGITKKMSSASQYAPVIFKIKNGSDEEINIFQSALIRDYNTAFSTGNLDKLVSEAGICIGHTYLSNHDKNKAGTFFNNNKGEITDKVQETFKELGDRIKAKQIWNPTLKDMVSFFNNFEHLRFVVDENGEVRKLDNPKTDNIITRRIDD